MNLRERWTRFWFEPAPPVDLGVSRILFFGLMLAVFARKDFGAFGDVSNVFWQPVWLLRFLAVPPPSHGFGSVVQVLWKLSLLLSCVGWATRWSTATAALLGTYLLGLSSSFGWIDHADQILVFAMAILALSRCGDACSVDRLVRVGRQRGLEPELSPAGEYRWPGRMVLLVMACVFFAAGVAKVRNAGVVWVTSGALSSYLIRANDPLGRSVSAPLVGVGLALAQSPSLSRAFAAASVLLELFFPLALISRRARRVAVPASLVMLVTIQALMGADFLRFLIAYVFFPPWHRLRLHEAAGKGSGKRHALIYDGSCGLCQGTVAVLRRLDLLHRIDFLDALRDWPRTHEAFPSLRQDACLETMHVVTAGGRVETGFDAYRALSWSLPLAWPIDPFLYLPGAAPIGRRVYEAVAARRHCSGCATVPEGPPVA